jgi:hypothetical protein
VGAPEAMRTQARAGETVEVLAMDVEALRKLYPFEFEAASIKANAKVAENLVRSYRRRTRGGHRCDLLAEGSRTLDRKPDP